MKELSFLLSLKNRLTAPLGKAQASVERFAKSSEENFKRIAIGGAALWGVGQTIGGMLNPAHDLQLQLDELSINVDSSGLDEIYKKAQSFSTDYGSSATDFVRSSIAIKRSIAGLTDKELPRYAVAVNTLGVALGKSGEETAQYLSDMQNRYSTIAGEMGRVQFAEMMASKTAYLAKNFGTDMSKIQGMIKATKNVGEYFAVDMNEQLAVLGLVGQELGEEAGGAYNAFLKSVTGGAEKLGLQLTDKNGRLLQMPQIMQKLEAKYGKSIAGNAKAQQEINAAFGEGASVINALWGDTEKLNLHMNALGKTRGLDAAGEMAAKMADQWARLDKTFQRVRIAIGMQMMPTLSPFLEKIITIGVRFAEWLDMFPNITRWLGYILIGIVALAAVGAIVNIVWGIAAFVWSGLIIVWGGAVKIIKLLRIQMIVTKLLMFTWNVLVITATAIMWTFSVALKVARVAFMLLTSPVTWIIALIGLLAYGVYYAINNWEDLKASIMESAAFQWIMGVIQDFGNLCLQVWDQICIGWQMLTDYLMDFALFRGLVEIVSFIGDLFGAVWDFIKLGWQFVVDIFSGVSPAEAFGKFADGVANIFSNLWKSITEKFTIFYNWIADKLNYLPGVDIELKPLADSGIEFPDVGIPAVDNPLSLPQVDQMQRNLSPTLKIPEAPSKPNIDMPARPQRPDFSNGGIAQSLQNSKSTQENNDNRKMIGTLNYYASEPQTADQFMERMELNAG